MNPTADTTPTTDRTTRFTTALRLLRRDRAPGGDYRPTDEPLVDAWNHIQERCANDRTQAAEHIDRFLHEYLDDLRDLAERAQDGCGPTLLLDRIERAVAAVA